MNPDTLVLIMTAAIAVAAAAIVLQTILLIVIAAAARATRKQVTSIAAKVEPLSESAQALLSNARSTFGEVSAKTTEILDISRTQLGRVDEIMAEATVRTRAQMDRIEMVLDDTVNRFQETTTLLQNGVIKPVRQLAGVTAAVRVAVATFFGSRRATVEQATHDEEMFI